MQGDGSIQATTGIAVTRWVARILAAIEILVGVFILAGIFLPAVHKTNAPLPLVLKGAPFGTFEQSTTLGIYTLVAGFILALVGGVLAFRWERVAAGIFTASGVVQAFLWAMWFATFPADNRLIHLLVGVVPPLVIAALLLVVSRHPLATRGR